MHCFVALSACTAFACPSVPIVPWYGSWPGRLVSVVFLCGSFALLGCVELSDNSDLCYIFVFFGTLFVGGLINRLLARVIKISGLGGFDRFLGIFFGLARGALIILVFIAVCYYLVPVQNDRWWKESALIPHFVNLVEWLGPILWEQSEQILEKTEGSVI